MSSPCAATVWSAHVTAAEVAPATAHVPPIFGDDALTVLGRVVGEVPRQITLRGRTGREVREWSAKLSTPADGGVIATLWARRKIQDIEESGAAEKSAARSELLKLSQAFGLLCSETAFVAVEHRSAEERNEGRPALRRIPIGLARGWGGVDACRAAPAPIGGGISFCVADIDDGLAEPGDLAGSAAPVRSRFRGASAVRNAVASPAAPIDALHGLLALQSAEGWFDWNKAADALLKALGRSREVREAVAKAVSAVVGAGSEANRAQIRQTVLAVLLFRRKFADRSSLWKAACDKAIRYLAAQLGKRPSEAEAWLAAVQSAVGENGRGGD